MTNFKRKFLIVFLAILCALCLAFGLTACDDSSSVDPSGTTDSGNSDDSTSGTDPDTDSTTNPDAGSDAGSDTNPTAATITGVSVTVKDVAITLPYDTYSDAITFESGELYINLGDLSSLSSITMYADGELVYNSGSVYTRSYAATLYGDGENVYIVYSMESTNTDDPESDKTVITVSYNYIETMLDSMIDKYTAQYADQIDYYTEVINGYISGDQTVDESVMKIVEVLLSYSDNISADMETLVNSFYTTTTTTDGVTYTYDVTPIQTLVKNVYELTCSQLVDEYLGEGTFETIQTTIAGLGEQNVYELITGLTTDAGIDNETLFAFINYIVTAATGEEFDISAILNADGDVDSQYAVLLAIKDMTVDEFLTAYAEIDTASIAEMVAAYADVNLFAMMYPNEEEAASVYATIDGILTDIKNKLIYSVTQYTDGNIAVRFAADEFSLEIEGAFSVTVNGEIIVSTASAIPSYASDMIADANGIYAEIAAVVDELLDEGKYQLTDEMYLTGDSSSIKLVNGTESYIIAEDAADAILIEVNDGTYYIDAITLDGAATTTYIIKLNAEYDENDVLYYEVYAEITIAEYDENGNELTHSLTGTDYSYTYTYTYDANGNKLTEKYDNGEGYSYYYVYNEYGWETSTTYTYSDGTIDTFTYEYEITDVEDYGYYTLYYVTVTETDSNNETYTYDTTLPVYNY